LYASGRSLLKDLPPIIQQTYHLPSRAHGKTNCGTSYATCLRGALPHGHSAWFEVINSGSWHNHAPGETRIRLDYSSLITLYDPVFTSLTEARRDKTSRRTPSWGHLRRRSSSASAACLISAGAWSTGNDQPGRLKEHHSCYSRALRRPTCSA